MNTLITVSYDLPSEALSTRAINRARRKANLAAAAHFVTNFLGKRFDGSMVVELGWGARDPKYNAWKLRNRGHTVPHLKNGTTRAAAKNATFKAALKRITIEVPGASRGYDSRPTKSGISLRNELSRTSSKEGAALSVIWKNAYEEEIRAALAAPLRRGRKKKGA